MPFTFADFEAEYQNKSEHFATEVADIKPVTIKEANELFPGISLSESPSLVYFPFKLCHSLPNINKRGRCFTGPVLAKSFATAIDSLIDLDHLILANNLSIEDKICGHIKATKVQIAETASIDEIADVPLQPIPVLGLGCLYLRAQQITKLVKDHITGKEKWSISMECGHNLKETCIFYDSHFIPLPEADEALLKCIQGQAMLPYKDKPTALALGGTKGCVDFWGAGLTKTPADGDATIFHFVAAKNREAASAPASQSGSKNFFMPFRYFPGTELEVASVPSKINELASLAILGETDEADGHKHIILNDLTIMPSNGHMHSNRTVLINPGTKPTLTGVTDSHHVYVRESSDYPSQSVVHVHSFNIPLNKKNKSSSNAETSDDSTISYPESANVDSTNFIENLKKAGEFASMAKTLQDTLTELNVKLGELSSLKDAPAITAKQAEIASIQKDIAQFNSEASVKSRVDDEIKAQIKAGTLLSKESADALVEAAKTEAEQKAAKEKEEADKKAARLESVRTAGIDPNYGLPGLNNADNTPMTIGDVVNSLSMDDVGERQFTINMASWKAMADQAKQAAGKQAADKQAEAANAGAGKKAVSKSIVLAAGAGTTSGSTGNTGTTTNEVASAGFAAGKGKSRFMQKA